MKEVLRKCQGCGKIIDRSNLIKITKSHMSDEIKVNPSSSFLGRSLYLCPQDECLKAIVKKKKLIREFKLSKEQEEILVNKLKEVINSLPR